MTYELLGTVKTVRELVDLLHDNAINENASVHTCGVECHVIAQSNEKGNVINIIFEDNDYTDEWNEEEQLMK